MDRDIPIFNRPVVNQMQKKNYQLHLQRLSSIKHKSQNRTTISYWSRPKINNNKTTMIQEEKKIEIQKQNVILFSKMTKIMKRADQHCLDHSYTLKNHKIEADRNRIYEENRNMFVRLDQQKPTFSNKKLAEERGKNLTILKFLGKYPNPATTSFHSYNSEFNDYQQRYSDYKRNSLSTHNRMAMVEEFEVETDEDINNKMKPIRQEKLNGQRRFKSQFGKRNSQRCKTVSSKKIQYTCEDIRNHQSIQMVNQDIQQSFHQHHHPKTASSIRLYQAKAIIQRKPAQISFYRQYDYYKIVVDFETPIYGECVHWIDLTEVQGSSLLGKYNYEYKTISNMLSFKNRSLCIDENKKKMSMKNSQITNQAIRNNAKLDFQVQQIQLNYLKGK